MRCLFLLGVLLSGCVRYTALPVTAEAVAGALSERAPGALGFEEALAYAREHNPALRRLRLEAEAAGLDVPPTSIGSTTNTVESRVSGFVDPFALFKVGPRGARAQAAEAREAALLEEWRGRDLDVAAGIAEAFLVERVLASLDLPEIDSDPELFGRAGLASDVDRERVRYALAKRRAEQATVAALRAENESHVRRLLGLMPGAEVSLRLPEGEFPPLPARDGVAHRPDVRAALARYRVADREFRAKVWDQYPVIGAGPTFNWKMSRWGLFLPVRIPVGAAGPAKAAGKRREAARHAVEEAVLRAEEDAERGRHRLARAGEEAEAARLGAKTAAADLHSALVHLEVTPDAFSHLAMTAPEAVERVARARAARLEAARARVDLARALAWPHAGEDDR